ncbi:MAG: hypothetical protein ACTSU5_12950 [Promethearchaeota archaeon]
MESCLVCHKPVRPEEERAVCPNGHLVHKSPCLESWYTLSKRKDCPFCGGEFTGRDVQSWFAEFDREISRKAEVEKKRKRTAEQRKLEELEKVRSKTRAALKEVKDLLEEGRVEEALDAAFALYEANPRDVDAQFLVGRANLALGKYSLAVNFLMKVVKAQSRYPWAYYYLGLAYENLEMPDKARWAFEREGVNFSEFQNSLVYEPGEYPSYFRVIADKLDKLGIESPVFSGLTGAGLEAGVGAGTGGVLGTVAAEKAATGGGSPAASVEVGVESIARQVREISALRDNLKERMKRIQELRDDWNRDGAGEREWAERVARARARIEARRKGRK